MFNRREFLSSCSKAFAGGMLISNDFLKIDMSSSNSNSKPLNILLFTADDGCIEGIGCYGGKPSDMTPNIDKFAAQGMRFTRAHVNSPICVPSRNILNTGLYGHNSEGMGFSSAVRDDVPAVFELFQNAGYLAGILGKVAHSTPRDNPMDQWDYAYNRGDLGNGANPELYYQRTIDFFDMCKEQDKPFYMMVNSHDPHRSAWSRGPDDVTDGAAQPSKWYSPDEVHVPGYLSDLPDTRKELGWWQSANRRMDDTFGRVMDALEEKGYADNTLVMFIIDNGRPFPFAKANTYLFSSKTPWIVRWPGVVSPGRVDNKHFISGIDYFSTVCEAAGIEAPPKQDGFSFVPLLKGQNQQGRDRVYTQIDWLAGRNAYPMRAVQDDQWLYIFNAWSGETGHFYRNNNQGITFRAMENAGQDDPSIEERVSMFRYRVLEELYLIEDKDGAAVDPYCVNNLIDSEQPEATNAANRMRDELEKWMEKVSDPILQAFRLQNDLEAREAALTKVYGDELYPPAPE